MANLSKGKMLLIRGRTYVLKPFHHPRGWSSPTKYVSYRDNQKWRYFNSVSQFEREARADGRPEPPDFALASIEAEAISTVQGERILRQLVKACDERSEKSAESCD